MSTMKKVACKKEVIDLMGTTVKDGYFNDNSEELSEDYSSFLMNPDSWAKVNIIARNSGIGIDEYKDLPDVTNVARHIIEYWRNQNINP